MRLGSVAAQGDLTHPSTLATFTTVTASLRSEVSYDLASRAQPGGAEVTQIRLALDHSTHGRLLQLQALAVGEGLGKPSLSELVAGLIHHASINGDTVRQLLEARPHDR